MHHRSIATIRDSQILGHLKASKSWVPTQPPRERRFFCPTSIYVENRLHGHSQNQLTGNRNLCLAMSCLSPPCSSFFGATHRQSPLSLQRIPPELQLQRQFASLERENHSLPKDFIRAFINFMNFINLFNSLID